VSGCSPSAIASTAWQRDNREDSGLPTAAS
jgi:hypothetical protein